MIIGLAYLLVLASVPLARGRLSALADLPLRKPGARARARSLIQIVVISVLPTGDHTIHTTLHLALLRAARRVRVRQPPHRRRADHRARRPARTSSRSRPTAASCRRARTRSRRSPAPRPRGRVRQLARAREPASSSSSATSSPRPPRCRCTTSSAIGDVHPADRRLRARARRLRLARRPAPLPLAAARRRLMFRAALSGAPARRFFAAHAQSCLGTGLAVRRAAAARLRPLRHALGGRRRPAARPAAGDRPRPAARRARRPHRLAHLRRRRRRPALPRLPAS